MKLGVSYISAFLPQHIEADMKQLKAIGCDEVLFAIQENHIHYLDGAVKYGAKIAMEQGLTPYACLWGYANTFGGGRMSKFLFENLDVLCEDRFGRKLPTANLNHPKLSEQLIHYYSVLIEHGFQGVFIDEPTSQVDYSRYSQELYYALFGEALTYDNNDAKVEQFQRHSIRRYVDRVCGGIKERYPDVKTIVCVMPHDHMYWRDIAELDSVDVFGTDPYWLFEGHNLTMEGAVECARKMKRLCDEIGKASQIWLNCWGVEAGREEEIYIGGKKLAEIGCDSLYTWSYLGGLGTNESCDDPYKAWDSVVRLYRECSGICPAGLF